MPTLDKGANAKALHLQLVAHFRHQILEGHYLPGSKLPTEMQISEQNGISRGTVRQALNTLVNEGLLVRVPGKGTFVLDSFSTQARPAEKRIGLLLNQPTLQLSMEILIGVEQAAKSRGYELNLFYSADQEQQAGDIARVMASQISGIILFPVCTSSLEPVIKEYLEAGRPLVLVDRYIPDLDTDYVVADNFSGAFRATEHLIILGHSRIGFAYSATDDLSTTSVRDRWRGYQQALEEYGLGYDDSLVFGNFPVPLPAAPNNYDSFIHDPKRPAAIFAVNDTLALGILQAAQRNGVNVPEELALVGFDDLSFAPYLTPPLTTVGQPRTEIGVRAANLLINRIEGQTGPCQHLKLPTNLVVRTSCGARLHVRRMAMQSGQ